MEWQAIGIACQILLLGAAWVLFQRARGELSVRAAEMPVLGEVKSLQKTVKLLLSEIEVTADKQSRRIEAICSDATALLADIETRIRYAEELVYRAEDTAARLVNTPGLAANGLLPEHAAALSARQTVAPPATEPDSGAVLSDEHPTAVVTLSVAEGPRDSTSNRCKLVFAMADSGESAAAIARAARLSEGEVETLLSLRAGR